MTYCYIFWYFCAIGKSTLINIITGMVVPTHGKVFMMGLDVETDASQVQQIIGVCPQDDILWDDLTAVEHMHLVAAFKGLRVGPVLNNVRKHYRTFLRVQKRTVIFHVVDLIFLRVCFIYCVLGCGANADASPVV